MAGEAAVDRSDDEARIRIDGGFAYIPGLMREQVVRFRDLAPCVADEIVRSADDARFFDRPATPPSSLPDARTYTLCLSIGSRTHEACIAEPIADPALARLVGIVRQLARQRA